MKPMNTEDLKPHARSIFWSAGLNEGISSVLGSGLCGAVIMVRDRSLKGTNTQHCGHTGQFFSN